MTFSRRDLLVLALFVAFLAVGGLYLHLSAGMSEARTLQASDALGAHFEQALEDARTSAQAALKQQEDAALQDALEVGLEEDLAWARGQEEQHHVAVTQVSGSGREGLVRQAGWLVAVPYVGSAAAQAGVRSDIPSDPGAVRDEALTRLQTTRITGPVLGEGMQDILAQTSLNEKEVRDSAGAALTDYARMLARQAEKGTSREQDAAARRLLALLLVLETSGGTTKK